MLVALVVGMAAVTAVVQAATKMYGFVCTVGRVGSDPCGEDTYTMSQGKYVKVGVTSSGGKKVRFIAIDAATDKELGHTVYFDAGDRKRIWTNDTGYRVRVRFKADAEGLRRVRITGRYVFGDF